MHALLWATLTWQAAVDFFSFDASRAVQPDMFVRYALQLLLLCGSAFFSGSETALFSLSHVDLQQLRQKRHRHAERLQALLDEPRRLIVSILCGNELVNIAAIVAGPLSRWVRLIGPVRWVVRHISDRITTCVVGPQRASEHILQIDEFRSVIEDVAETGKLHATARMLINNLLSAGATEIVKIMTPRSRTVFLNADLGVPELIEGFREAGHSRVPVYRQHRDNLIGFLHAEDVLRLHLDRADVSILKLEDIVHAPVVVPLTKTVDEMFDFFVKNNVRSAAALNEFGGVAGFITVNDVLRSIFGPLTHRATVETRIKQIGPNTYEMPGDTKRGEFNRVTTFGVHDPRLTTIAGIAFRHIDRLPRIDDQVVVDGVTITVLEMDAHRIAQVRVTRGEDNRDTVTTSSDESTEPGSPSEIDAAASHAELGDDKKEPPE